MILNRRISLCLFTLIFIGFSLSKAQAQNLPASTETNQRQAESHKDREPPGEVDLLKIKVEQLQSLVEQQQRILAAMERRLKEVEEKSPPPTLATTNPSLTKDVRSTTSELAPGDASKDSAPIKAASQSVDKDGKPLAGWDTEHAYLHNADGSFTTKIIGYGQFDFRGYQSGNHPPDTFLPRRVRLGVEGKVSRYFDYKVLADFADTRSALLRDLYIGIHRSDKFQLRFGQFKEPFSQEELTPDTNIDFVEYAMTENLVPSRSPGMMAFGVVNKGKFEYYVGAFNGKGLLATNNSNTPEGVVRVRFAPWKNEKNIWFKGFAFGGAFAQGRNNNGTSVQGQTESRSFIFYTPETIHGNVLRANGEFIWNLGPATIRTEYDQTNQERENLGDNGTSLPGIVAKGFMSQFTYLLTGESKSDSGVVTPKRNVFENGFGAWELKARYSKLQISDGSEKSNQAQTIYVGTNWYLNRYVRYLFDLGIERFNDPLRSPRPTDRNYLVVLSRIQLVF